MSMQAVGQDQPRFRIGGVLGTSLKVLLRNIVPFGILAALFSLPELLIVPVLIAYGLTVVDFSGIAIVAGFLIPILFWLMLIATLVYGTIMDLGGNRAGLVASISRGLRSLLPVILVCLLVWLIDLAVGLFCLLPVLIFPALAVVSVPAAFVAFIVIMIMFWVAIPAAVVERPGVVASLQRSMALTEGDRWRILGLLLILFAANILIDLGSSALGASLVVAGIVSEAVVEIVQFTVHIFLTAFVAVAIAVSYHDLKVAKEGSSVDEIAAVFD